MLTNLGLNLLLDMALAANVGARKAHFIHSRSTTAWCRHAWRVHS